MTAELLHGRTIYTARQTAVAGTELGTISIVEEGGRSCAYWCGVGDAGGVFLCSVDAAVYGAHAKARELLMALAAEAASHRERGVVVGKTAAVVPWWAELECAKCSSPQAGDVMHLARAVTELSELALSPGGHPMGCCKVRTVAVMGGDPNAARSAAR